MYCRQCGTLHSDGVAVCSSCGATMPTYSAPASPSSTSGGSDPITSAGNDPRGASNDNWASNDSGNPYSRPVQDASQSVVSATQHPVPAFGKPDSYLVPAILVTFCCCLPFGVPAIVYAAQVDSKWNLGDRQGAEMAAAEAKKWTMLALFLGLGVQVLPFLFYIVLVIAAVAAGA